MDRACFESISHFWVGLHDVRIVRFNPDLWNVLETSLFLSLSLSRFPGLDLGAGVETTNSNKL
jgi:hypothetical protein